VSAGRPAFGIPIGRPPARATTPVVDTGEGLLLVGHGSRCPVGAAEMAALRDLAAGALPGVAVEVGYLEMTDPPAGVVLDRLVAGGARRVVVLPLMLLGAGHTKSDVPAVVLEARERHPGIDIRYGPPLGVARDLVARLGDAVGSAGGRGWPLLLIARGTSDPDANGDACKVTRLLSEWTAAPFAHTAFTGVTTPSVADGLDVFRRLGLPRLVVAWWFLCHGKLIERGRDDVARFVDQTGIDVVDAGHIGADAAVAPLVAERYHEALEGAARVNCDACAYRAPWPGLHSRLGQAIGVGHSHLAEAHRHAR
jgi:sirohydrochlorin cobaltochelatase